MLARTMGRTLEELGETMSSAEFGDHWLDWVYAPWGDRRADIHAALVCKTVADYAGKTLKEGHETKLEHFLLDFDRDEKLVEEMDPNTFFGSFIK